MGRKKERKRAKANRSSHGSGEPIVVGGPHAVAAVIEQPKTVEELLLEVGAGRRAADLAARAREAGVVVRSVGAGDCEAASGVRCQGVAARIRYRYADFDRLLESAEGVLVFLDGIADPHNLGAIVRTAEAAGALGVVIPARRSVGVTATVMRVSAGAAAAHPVARVSNLVQALKNARESGFWLIGLAQDGSAQLGSGGPWRRLGLVLGGEGRGLRPLVAEGCDEIARLPMRGQVESLNVSVAAGIALYRVRAEVLFPHHNG